MPQESSPALLVDAAKASASKIRERQVALDARAKELDTLKAHLEAERANLEARAATVAADREAVAKDRQELDDVKASLERDLASINEGRARLGQDEETLKRALKSLEDRERTVKADEERAQRLEESFARPMKEAEQRLRGLLEHEEELTRLQKEWLAAVEARQSELQSIAEKMHARQAEVLQQHGSLTSLRDGLKNELERLLEEQEKLAAKEKTILDAEEALAAALQVEGFEPPQEEPKPEPAPAAPEPAASPAPEPTPQPAPAPEPAPLAQEEIPREPEPKQAITKGEATERLSKAVEAWKRARDAGWKVIDIRKTVKVARDAIEAGDYERAVRCATDILEPLQAAAAAK